MGTIIAYIVLVIILIIIVMVVDLVMASTRKIKISRQMILYIFLRSVPVSILYLVLGNITATDGTRLLLYIIAYISMTYFLQGLFNYDYYEYKLRK